jgi:LPPG:FO 2-phospho-L-lactate transferase
MKNKLKIVALAGGVGGAKLAHGLAQVLPPEDLTIIVNTGDDFEHYGLYICPDLDTVCYTLAGIANPETGWGRSGETWNMMENLSKLGGADWFRLGDKDLGTHLERTQRLKEGYSLSQITKDFCNAWGIGHTVLPMSDKPVRTFVETDEGELEFQEYFVHRRCEPRVRGFWFDGIDQAEPVRGAREALQSADAVIICPSNPWVSIDPILATFTPPPLSSRSIPEGERERGWGDGKKVVAISPIIGGETVKGPAAKMYRELGIEPSALAVANHYRGLVTDFVLDKIDEQLNETVKGLSMRAYVTNTLMRSHEDRKQLAIDLLTYIGSDL